MIMNGRASLRLTSAGLLALALLAAATLPAWASGTGDSQQQPQATKVTEAPQTVQADQPKPKPSVKPGPKAKPIISVEKVPHVVSVRTSDHPQAKWIQGDVSARYWAHVRPETLTDEGQKLVTDYSTDLEAIQKEMEAKLEARREAVIQSLQALQDQYTKAGKLDEAVAIRDYLKAGGPGGPSQYWTSYKVKR